MNSIENIQSERSQLSPQNIIFVGGSPRSGTTLVQRVLNSHVDVYGGAEFDLIPRLAEDYQIMVSKVRSGRIDTWIREDEVKKAFRNLLVDIFSNKAKSEAVSHISEKTPANILVFSQLYEFLPEARYVFVIRDPRAIAASMLKVGARQKKLSGKAEKSLVSTRGACKWISSHIEAGSAACRENDAIIVVRYEELVADEKRVSARLFQQLGLSLDAIELDKSHSDLATDPETWKDGYYSKEEMVGGVRTGSVASWKEDLSWLQQAYIKIFFSRSEMLAATYSLECNADSIGSRLIRLLFYISDALAKWKRKLSI